MGHFHLLIAAVLVAAAIHIARMKERTTQRAGEVALLYLLVGYCGFPTLAFAVTSLAHPEQVAATLGFPAGNPFQEFASVALLAMAILSVLTLRYRGSFLIGPAILWAVFFAGATIIHSSDHMARGALTHGSMLMIFATHGLISVLLAVALIASGVWKERPVSPKTDG